MYDSTEESLAKIDGVITDIRMINLHLYNYINCIKKEPPRDPECQKKIHNFHKQNVAHVQQFAKRVGEYLKKSFQEMEKCKIILPPIIFRQIQKEHQKEDYFRFQNQVYGVKFIITNLDKEAVMNIELYRRISGGKLTSFALRKLETTYTVDLSQKFNQGSVSIERLNDEGNMILQELTNIMKGEICVICNSHLAFNPDYKIYLPPTLIDESKDPKKKKKYYYHQSCL